MDATAKRRPASGRGSGPAKLRSALVRTAAWIVAVPLLCATVIVGGAVPLYLLLPEARPQNEAPAAMPKPATLASAPAKSATVAAATPTRPPKPATEPKAAPAPAAADEPPAEAASDEAPAADADAPAADDVAASAPAEEPVTVAAIPTPRPAPPRPVLAAIAAPAAPAPDEREEVSLEPSAPPEPERPDRKAATAGGGRAVILRTVTLRSSPKGRELGVLKQGSPVTVGRCEEWCEVRGDGASGWVHSSFLADSLPDRRGGTVASRRGDDAVVVRRIDRPRPPARRDDGWLDEGLSYGDDDDRPVARRAPRWVYEDERPRVVRRQPSPRFYDPYDGPYD